MQQEIELIEKLIKLSKLENCKGFYIFVWPSSNY